MKRLAFSLFLSLTISHSFACSPGQTRDIDFDFGSSAMGNSEILSLANWIVDTRGNQSALAGVSVIGLADAREHNPQRIAQERAKNVRAALDTLGVRATTSSVTAHVYKPMKPQDKHEPTGTRAEVTLIPDCAND